MYNPASIFRSASDCDISFVYVTENILGSPYLGMKLPISWTRELEAVPVSSLMMRMSAFLIVPPMPYPKKTIITIGNMNIGIMNAFFLRICLNSLIIIIQDFLSSVFKFISIAYLLACQVNENLFKTLAVRRFLQVFRVV
ncbi:Uncharacterised protein [uncultured archaeon]|nr:Uncharacterised protein [uncultured archaeon]